MLTCSTHKLSECGHIPHSWHHISPDLWRKHIAFLRSKPINTNSGLLKLSSVAKYLAYILILRFLAYILILRFLAAVTCALWLQQAVHAFPALHRLPSQVRVLRSRWGSEPLSRGSYSYVAAGASLEDVHILAQPLTPEGTPIPRVCFAGEATQAQFIGTTHGAFLSGQREARRLLQAFEPT